MKKEFELAGFFLLAKQIHCIFLHVSIHKKCEFNWK